MPNLTNRMNYKKNAENSVLFCVRKTSFVSEICATKHRAAREENTSMYNIYRGGEAVTVEFSTIS